MRGRAWILCCVTLGLVLTGCAPFVANSPTAQSAAVPTILPTPSNVASYNDKLLKTVSIDYPDEIVSVRGFIWVKTDNGHVVQVDPKSNTVLGDIKVDTTSGPSHYCQGLATDGDDVWACSAGGDADHRSIDVVRVDPHSKKVIATVKVAKIFSQFDMPFLLGRLWVLSGNGDKLVGIDTATNQPGPAMDLGARCSQLAVLDKMLLAACTSDNLILRIDPQKAQVVSRAPLQSPRQIVAAENGVWIAQDNAVVRLDAKSLNPIVVFSGLPSIGLTGDLYLADDAVWVRQDSGFLYRIDPAKNQLAEQIHKDEQISGGSLLVADDSIWTTASDDNMLIRLSR